MRARIAPMLSLIAAAVVLATPVLPPPPSAQRAALPVCAPGPRDNCVVDGDTLWLDGAKIRVTDIDTPEISEPGCPAEKVLGERARRRFQALLNAGPFDLVLVGQRDRDRNGRLLRVVMRRGRSLGDQLVAEGLARKWTGRREPWCAADGSLLR